MHAELQPLTAVLLAKAQRRKLGEAPPSATKTAPISAELSTKAQSWIVGAARCEKRSAPLASAAPPQLRMVRPERTTADGSELLKVRMR